MSRIPTCLRITLFFLLTYFQGTASANAQAIRFPIEGDRSASRGFAKEFIQSWCGFHLAVDVGIDRVDASVHPIADGVVKFEGVVVGYTVVIEYRLPSNDLAGPFVTSVYYHLKRPSDGGIQLRAGQTVKATDTIGYISGRWDDHQSSPHLHFGIRAGAYQAGSDSRTGRWFYPGYSTIYRNRVRTCNAQDPTHSQIIRDWYEPLSFIQRRETLGLTATPTLSSSLILTPQAPYVVGQRVRGTFTLTNRGGASVTLDRVLIGGRLNSDTIVKDFPATVGVSLLPNQSFTYTGEFTFTETGTYRFFPAYLTSQGWRIGLYNEIAADPGTINLVTTFVMGTPRDPLVTALANSVQPVRWFYIRSTRNGAWYIVSPVFDQVLLLDKVDRTTSFGIYWKPISNSSFPTYSTAETNYSSVTISPDGRTISFGASSPGISDPDVAALGATTEQVMWLYIMDEVSRAWYIVSPTTQAVMLLDRVDQDTPFGIYWRPISNSSFNGYEPAGVVYDYVKVSGDSRTISFGPLRPALTASANGHDALGSSESLPTPQIPVRIEGFVQTPTGAPLSGVRISFSTSQSAITDVSGRYSVTVTAGFSGTATPLLAGFTFSPATRTYSATSRDSTGQDYLATPQTEAHTLSLSIVGDGGGTVTSSPTGIQCSAGSCSNTFNANTTVELVARAAAGSTFAGWSGACSGTGNCSVVMSSAKDLIATFRLAPDRQPLTTVAGTNMWGFNGDYRQATTATLFYPLKLAVDSTGNIYVADHSNHRIRRISATTGQITTVAGTGVAGFNGDNQPAMSAQLHYPHGIAIDSAGNLFIADWGNHRIRKVIANTGLIITVAGTGLAGFNGDNQLATSSHLKGPFDVALDRTGNLLIADYANGRVRLVSANTGFISTVAGTGVWGFNGDNQPATSAQIVPTGLARDPAGNVFIVDGANHRVRRISVETGLITTVAGTGVPGFNGDEQPAYTAQLYWPAAVGVDSVGNLFIGDSYNHRVRMVRAIDGSITTVAGTGAAGFNGDNLPAIVGTLKYPDGVALDPNGNLFIADSGNNRIRRVASVAAQSCGYAVSPHNQSLGSSGGRRTVTVITSTACDWIVTSDVDWISLLSGSGGRGAGNVAYNVAPNAGASTRRGTLTISGQLVTITQSGAQASLPFGMIDSPADGAAGLMGSIGITGWALDDVEVAAIRIYRDSVFPEPNGIKLFVGNATFVEGARPDVDAAYSSYAFHERAGWGYLLLTNMLPNQGNGTYTLHAYADDSDGNTSFLGTRTISCNNAAATTPFGAIDTPAQGATVSGTAYINFGWALTPLPKAIPTDGSTIKVYIDGVQMGSVYYNYFRSDIATIFPGYANSAGPVGLSIIDTSSLTNGVHTIAWVVTDNAGIGAGIGSRYFTVRNPGTQTLNPSASTQQLRTLAATPWQGVRVDARTGFAEDADWRQVESDSLGRRNLQATEMERVQLRFPGADVREGYSVVGGVLKPLPTGTRLNATDGVFTWQPGVGFLGSYHFVFVTDAGVRIPIAIVLSVKEN